MMRGRMLAVFVAMLAGCGSSEDDADVTVVSEQQLIVRDENQQQRTIPASKLVDAETKKPTAKEIWVVDQTTKQRIWIDAQVFLNQHPTRQRFLPAEQ